MSLKPKLLPKIILASSFALVELGFFFPKLTYFTMAIGCIAMVLVAYAMVPKVEDEEKWYYYAIFPFFLFFSYYGYSLLLTNKFSVQALYVGGSLFLYYYFGSIYYYIYKPSLYRAFSIENISSYGNLLSFFFFASLLYGLQSFIDAPVWILMAALLAFSVLIVIQVVWANKISIKKGKAHIFAVCLALIEIAWSISYLPLKYNVAGMSLAIFYYMIVGLLRFNLLNKLDAKAVGTYLGFGFLSLSVLLLTAHWF